MEDKEHIYEEEIKPLVDRIYERVKELGIPFIMAFEVSETILRGSYSLPEGTSGQLELMAVIMERGAPTVLIGLARTQTMEDTPVRVVD